MSNTRPQFSFKKTSKYAIHTTSPAQKLLAGMVLGFMFPKAYITVSLVSYHNRLMEASDMNMSYPFVGLNSYETDPRIETRSSPASHQTETISFEGFVEMLPMLHETPEIKVKLNDSWDAVVSQEGIQVGCQKFSLETIQALADAAAKVKNA